MHQKHQELIIHHLKQAVHPMLIYVFGSAAKGTEHRDSDIDVAYLSENDIDDYKRFMLAQDIAVQLNKDVDLVDLKKASTVFQMQIVSTGKILYCDDELVRMNFEMKTYKMYAKLNEERQQIIDKIMESGSVYER